MLHYPTDQFYFMGQRLKEKFKKTHWLYLVPGMMEQNWFKSQLLCRHKKSFQVGGIEYVALYQLKYNFFCPHSLMLNVFQSSNYRILQSWPTMTKCHDKSVDCYGFSGVPWFRDPWYSNSLKILFQYSRNNYKKLKANFSSSVVSLLTLQIMEDVQSQKVVHSGDL